MILCPFSVGLLLIFSICTGKIYITLNRDPATFLTNNQFYDPNVLGAFCEKLDPHLAFVAYKVTTIAPFCVVSLINCPRFPQHAQGACDDALVRVTQENGLFKDLARYLVERQDLDLWRRVLR